MTKKINIMEYKGLSIIIRNEKEFNRVKDFLGAENLYLSFAPQMADVETSIVVFADYETYYSTGTTGSAAMQKENGLRLIEFVDFFNTTDL